MQRRYRVVVAEVGDDDGGPGVRPVARALRDAGFEVVSLGPVDRPEQVLAAAVQEDADAVGIGCRPGADPALVAAVGAGCGAAPGGGVACFVLSPGPAPTGDGIRGFPLEGPGGDVADWLRAELAAGDGP